MENFKKSQILRWPFRQARGVIYGNTFQRSEARVMPNLSTNLIDYLRTISGAWKDDTRDDAELLARFVEGDEEAYKTMIRRHGPLVWKTCRRVLTNEQNAEDVFQTTFIAL